MTENSSDDSEGGAGLLGVVIGAALVVAVAFFFFGGYGITRPQRVDVTIMPPAASSSVPSPASAQTATTAQRP